MAITGASGFIGSLLGSFARTQEWEVFGLDRVKPPNQTLPWRLIDITSSVPTEAVFGIDTMMHLAGKVHALAEVKQDEAEYFRINTQGTKNVLEACKRAGVRRFVFVSTVKAMTNSQMEGDAEAIKPWSERDAVDPDTPYGQSKLKAEKLVLEGGYVPEPVVLRLCMVYGPRAKGNIQKMIQAVAVNRFPPLPEFGNRRSMVEVRDVVRVALLAAESPLAVGRTFIVSDGRSYSTRQMYEMVCAALGKPIPSWRIPKWALQGMARVGDGIGRARGRRFIFDSDALEKLSGSAWFSSERLQTTLGFKPEWDLAKSLPDMVAEMGLGS